MSLSRRELLRIAGLGSLVGLGGKSAWALVQPRRSEASGRSAEAQTDPSTAGALVAGRWALVVDLPKCLEKTRRDGCRDCILACHQVHNVPTLQDAKHEIKWIWKESYEHTFPTQLPAYAPAALQGQPLPVLCNHCTNPPCVRVCPTQATFKRADGIVAMDYHRCIGCRYCMAACPYGSRSFNWVDPRQDLEPAAFNPDFPTRTKGVVEKCNFCEERLAKGQIPACVEACRVSALIFGDLGDPSSDVRKALQDNTTLQRRPEIGTDPGVYYLV